MSLSRLDDLSLWTQYALVCVYVHKGEGVRFRSPLCGARVHCLLLFPNRSMRKWRIWTFRHSMWSSPSSRLRWKVSVGPAEVVGAKTTVEMSTVAEMLVSKFALLGYLIVVSVGGTTASTRAPARAVANERHSVLGRIQLHFLMLCSSRTRNWRSMICSGFGRKPIPARLLTSSRRTSSSRKLHFSTLDTELMVLKMETASTSTVVFGNFYGYLLSGSLDAVKEFGQDDM